MPVFSSPRTSAFSAIAFLSALAAPALFSTSAHAVAATTVSLSAKATGCFGSPNTGCADMQRAVTLRAGEQISIAISGTVNLAGSGFTTGADGLVLAVGTQIGSGSFTSYEEKFLDANGSLPRSLTASGTPIPMFGSVMGAFVSGNTADNANFVARDSDLVTGLQIGIPSSSLFMIDGFVGTFTAPSDGVLFLGINETIASDNNGNYSVSIKPIDQVNATTATLRSAATGCFGSPNGGCVEMQRLIEVKAGQRFALSSTGTINLNASVTSTPEGVPFFTTGTSCLEEVLQDKGLLNRPNGDPLPVLGALIGAFVPSNTAEDIGFLPQDNDLTGTRAGIPSSTLFRIGSRTFFFTAPSDGVLFVGVNDTTASDNSGTYAVNVRFGANDADFALDAKASGLFGNPTGGNLDMPRVLDLKSGQRVTLRASGTVALASGLNTGPAGVTINVGQLGIGSTQFHAFEEKAVDNGSLIANRAGGTPIPQFGVVFGAFTPANTAQNSRFFQRDEDIVGAGNVGISSQSLFVVGDQTVTFTAPQDGALSLGVSDTASSDNSGSFTVNVAINTDSDNDGITDDLDPFPCQARFASVQFAPGENQHATLLFEDRWPSAFDFDFNDIVVDHHTELYRNAAGNITRVRGRFFVRAHGGNDDSGLAWHLPLARNVALSNGAVVSLQIGNSAVQTVSLRGDESESVIVLADNLRNVLFGGVRGPLNADATQDVSSGQFIDVTIDFTTGSSTINNALSLAAAPYDLFIFRAGDYSHQTHRTRFGGTDLMNTALFGDDNDGSGAGRFFVTQEGVPFVLELPTTALYPKEGQRIEALFPRIVDFGRSGGQNAQDFFSVGVNAGIGFTAGRNGAPPAAPSVVVPPALQQCQ